jgi:hypothetical protein
MISRRQAGGQGAQGAPLGSRAPLDGAPAPAGAGFAAFVLLLAGAVAAALLAVALAAGALNSSFSPLLHLGLPATHAAHAWLLLGAMTVLAVLVWLILRADEETLWLPGAEGGVLVPAAALQGLAERAACRHPEVVRAEARLRMRQGALRGTLRLYCRPLVVAESVRAKVEPVVRDELTAAAGAPLGTLVVRSHVLAVRQLKRHLP